MNRRTKYGRIAKKSSQLINDVRNAFLSGAVIPEICIELENLLAQNEGDFC